MKLKSELKFLSSVVLVLTAIGCASKAPAPIDQNAESAKKRGIDEFEKANALLDAKQYPEAAAAYDKLRVKNPATTLDFFILFNGGIAYQEAGDCKTAAERYKATIRVTNNKNPETQALARLRLSDVLSCEGNDKMAIVNLVELYKNRRFLPVEIAEAEVPARLAAAYARADNKKMAQKYFKEAEIGFRKVNSLNSTPVQRPILAKTLYLMGNMSHLDPEKISSQDYFTSIDALQGFLFRAVEMDVDTWSDLAANQLRDAYQKVWLFIDRDSTDKREQTIAAQTALISMKELTSQYVPNQKPNKRISALFASLDRTERQIEGFLITNRPGSALTNEAKKAMDVKQDGRTANPNPKLEKSNSKRR